MLVLEHQILVTPAATLCPRPRQGHRIGWRGRRAHSLLADPQRHPLGLALNRSELPLWSAPTGPAPRRHRSPACPRARTLRLSLWGSLAAVRMCSPKETSAARPSSTRGVRPQGVRYNARSEPCSLRQLIRRRSWLRRVTADGSRRCRTPCARVALRSEEEDSPGGPFLAPWPPGVPGLRIPRPARL